MSQERTATRIESEAPVVGMHPLAGAHGGAECAPAAERRGYMVRRLTVGSDLLAIVLSGLISAVVLSLLGRKLGSLDVSLFVMSIPAWPLLGLVLRTYHPHSVGRGLVVTIVDEMAPILLTSTVWSWMLIVARSIANPGEVTFLLPSLLLWATSVPVLLGGRALVRAIARRRGWYIQKVLVVGRMRDGAQVISRIERHPEWGLTVVGEVDVLDDVDVFSRDFGLVDGAELAFSVDVNNLIERAKELGASRVIFATPPYQLDARTDLTRGLIESGIQVDLVPGEAEILRSGAAISHLEGLPLMSMPGAMPPRSWRAMKRTVDLLIAVPVLVALSPVIAFAAIRVKRDSPGPVFYRQRRAGLHGDAFDFLKLRTMYEDAEQRLPEMFDRSLHENALEDGVFKVVDDPRITSAGMALRRLSIDELPQLWNVVRGDMSLVGPRPLPVVEDQRVAGHYEMRRHVRPGMTGPWQVSGRSDIPFHDMLRLDYSYVLNWSLSRDAKLLVQTLDAVVRGRGAY